MDPLTFLLVFMLFAFVLSVSAQTFGPVQPVFALARPAARRRIPAWGVM